MLFFMSLSGVVMLRHDLFFGIKEIQKLQVDCEYKIEKKIWMSKKVETDGVLQYFPGFRPGIIYIGAIVQYFVRCTIVFRILLSLI
jgi:hypothetical protein